MSLPKAPHRRPLQGRTRHPTVPALVLATLTLCLIGCASRPPATGKNTGGATASVGKWPDKDGADASPPPNLRGVPNANPQIEAIRKGGPNKPYEVLGERYEPATDDAPLVQRGLASWYGNKFHGRPTSSGEVYNMYAMTAAHATMPIPSYARVRNPANGQEVIVRINDRGPFHKGRIIDLSYTAALKLGVLHGVSNVEVTRITYEDIRSGKWQGDRAADPVVAAAVTTQGASQVAEMVAAPATVVAAAERAGALQAPEPASLAKVAAPVSPVTDSPGVMPSQAAPGFWVQFGAFAKLDGAESFRKKLVQEADWMAPWLAVFKDKQLHRLQAGPYASREDARQAAERVRLALAVTSVVIERR
ncbi:septal ring lytic transglycosylase RlpA family protein [Roseateles koreensis]|uniref:Endolytic peptidoglycan transglycosylase RlpA n=1 Tax=Roseateles koreensis TaxID=2987526 RepID=A0ABT5KPG7_9BURK|nr:septal ring lytic transglycosylase RlpA family protein [Roseateles koreensis]MDC8784818.1 septal ring lytic transglycosylase RlpA family protein [Roseateles koreensis]